MIIGYDRNPNAPVDRKVQSLMESVQLALNEHATDISMLSNKVDNLPQSSGSGGGDTPTGGSYNDLSDKPIIEGVTLVGAKSFPELNLNCLTNTEIYDIFENLSI